MKIQIYKCWGYLHYNINYEIVNGSSFVLMESGFQNSWIEANDWWLVRKVQG